MSFAVVTQTLASAVATSGTFTVAYPDNTDAGTYRGATGHKMTALGAVLSAPGDFTLTFGTSNITVTYSGTTTLPAGTQVRVQLEKQGEDDGTPDDLGDVARTAFAPLTIVSLGAPDVADVDGVFEAFSGAAGSITLDGALVSGGVATLDVPRNLVADSGGVDTAVLTITGADEYGNTVVENITLNGTTAVAGKKAFKTVTSVVSSATIANGAFLGTGDVLGLPVFLPGTGHVVREMEDGAAPTDGTLVAGVTSTATATTGDVRGTYDPNSAADGSKVFELLVALPDPTYRGIAQFAG